MTYRASTGYRLAQAGAVLMVLGGLVDLCTGELFPHHVAALGAGGEVVPADAARLVLSLLRALGGALVAAGVAILVLLRQARRSGDRLPLLAGAFVALAAEGPNTLGLLDAGSILFLAPLTFMLLVVTGVALTLAQRGAGHGAAAKGGRAHTQRL